MATHQQLIDEMSRINNMGTEERLRHAQRRRAEQLDRWKEYETLKSNQTNGSLDNKKTKLVKFGDCITLLEAAARNDYKEVKEILEGKIDPNEANEDGLTALHQACIDNFEEIVEVLLDYGANVNAVDSEYWTPLHAACTCGHTNIAEMLVKRGADLLALNADQNMPYDICDEIPTLQFVEQAMANEGITQQQINDARQSMEKLILKDVSEYFENGGDINVTDKVGATILHFAAANGYTDLMRYFLRCSPTVVNAQDKDGWTALHAAACWCQMEIIEVLAVEYNADVSVKNNLGEIPADVTEDDEVKALLQKVMQDQKVKKSRMIRRSRISAGGSTRVSTVRGQSFKGRSRRDKKKGISSLEANSEAEFWQKGQKTDLDNEDSDDDESSTTNQNTALNHVTSFSKNDQTTSYNHDDVDRKSNKARNNSQSKGKKLNVFKNNLGKGRHASTKDSNKKSQSDLNLRRTKSDSNYSDAPPNAQDRLNGDVFDRRSNSIGRSKSRKRGCVIL